MLIFMPPVHDEAGIEVEHSSVPNLMYELDNKPFDAEQKMAIDEMFEGQEGKYIVVGEDIRATKEETTAFIVFFPIAHKFSHKRMLEKAQARFPEYVLKVGGKCGFTPGDEYISRDAPSLARIMDLQTSVNWLGHLGRTLEIFVLTTR